MNLTKKSLVFTVTMALSLFFSFLQIRSQAQCMTSYLNISTGFNPSTGTLTTPSNTTSDPRWGSQPSTTTRAAIIAMPDIVGAYNALTAGTGWPAVTGCNWLMGQNDWGYNTGGAGLSSYIDTFNRCFRLCGNDSINIIYTIHSDDGIINFIIDNTSISAPAFTTGISAYTGTFHLGSLASGEHILRIIVRNEDNGSYKNATGLAFNGYVQSASSTASIENDSCEHVTCCNCNSGGMDGSDTTCSETCYWKLTGNHISSAKNIFGTITNDDVNIMTDNINRGIFTKDGMFGWNTNPTTDPTSAYLHINCTGHNQGPTLSDIRFENLETNPKGNIMVIDPQSGYVFNSGINLSNPVTLSCSSTNILPKVTGSGVLGCSIVYDNGASVGINKTSGFTYTWAGGLSGTTPPPGSGIVALDVNGVARALAYIATSDERLKTNINSISNPFKLINGLMGKTYSWSQAVLQETHADNSKQYGFIAQDVAKVMPEAVIVDSAGTYGINYNSFIPVLTEGEKELYTMYQQEKANNDKLQSQLDDLKARLDDLANCCANNTVTSSISKDVTANTGNALYQNVPNPFNKETSIDYFISKINGSAAIIISDLSGKEMSRYQIATSGQGSISVKVQNMVPGIYLYTLVVDGSVIDTKKMVIGG